MIREALSSAKIAMEDVDAVAVAHRPGLIGSLLVGVTAAKTLAMLAEAVGTSATRPSAGPGRFAHAAAAEARLNGAREEAVAEHESRR